MTNEQAITKLWEAIGRYSVQVSTSGELAPPQELRGAMDAIAALLPSAADEPVRWEIRSKVGTDNEWMQVSRESYERASSIAGWEVRALYPRPASARPSAGVDSAEPESWFADEDSARHWIDRYAAGIDEEPQIDRIAACLAGWVPPSEGWSAADLRRVALAAPAPPPADAVRALVGKWAQLETFWSQAGTAYGDASATTYSDCADELEAALSAAPAGDGCTEPNRAACPRMCMDFCNKAETAAAPTPEGMTVPQIEQWIGACNHEPARQVLRHYLRLTQQEGGRHG